MLWRHIGHDISRRYLILIPGDTIFEGGSLLVKDWMDPVSENIYCIGWTLSMMIERVIPSIVVLEMDSYEPQGGIGMI